MGRQTARWQDGETASNTSPLLDSLTPRLLDSVTAAASQHHEEAVALLQELVRVPSVNPYFTGSREPSREGAAQDILADRLHRLGAQLDRWEPNAKDLAHYAGGPGYYPDRDFRGRPNLAGTLQGSGGGRSLLRSEE